MLALRVLRFECCGCRAALVVLRLDGAALIVLPERAGLRVCCGAALW